MKAQIYLTAFVVAVLLAAINAAAQFSDCPPQWTTPPPPCEPPPDGCCPPGAGGGGSGPAGGGCGRGCGFAVGMPVWQVSESRADYRLFDTPLRYVPAKGPAISLDLVYQTWQPSDFSYYPRNDANPLFGPQWHCLWSSDLVIYDPSNGKTYWNYLGGRIIYQNFTGVPLVSDPAYQDGSRVEIVKNGGGTVIGGKVRKGDGTVLEYLQGHSATRFLLTSFIDSRGHALTFSYDGYGRLNQISAATGETATFTYGDLDGDSNPANNRVVTQVSAPGGLIATFAYTNINDGNGSTVDWHLTNITDTVQISSGFTYRQDGFWGTYYPLATMQTPYGTTRFDYLGGAVTWGGGIAVRMTMYGTTLLVTEPNGGQHLYIQSDASPTAPPVPASFDAGVIPTGLPLNTMDTTRQGRNSFHWGPLQLASIGNLSISNWTWTEFKRAHIRHWLGYADPWDNGHTHISDTLAWEQAPSPDGVVEGQVTWYDYAGKNPSQPTLIGTGTEMPAVIARVLPDGTTWYEYFEHNSLGKRTLHAETYTKPDGSTGLRTNIFQYSADKLDMTRHIGFNGEQVVSNRFNAFHQITNSFNALNELTEFTYNANQQLICTKTPSGLTTTNIYDANGYLTSTIDLEIDRTNTFTYANGLLFTHRNERGLMVTNYWDALQRPISTVFPDGTYTSNRYHRLDLFGTRDRLGNWTYFAHNSMRQRTAVTNALGKIITYEYCICGALDSITDALTNTTRFYYDLAGQHLATVYPDSSWVSNRYDRLGRITNVSDSAGMSVTNWYNKQGLIFTASNGVGRLFAEVFDKKDRVTNSVDAGGITNSTAYDDLDRVTRRGYGDGTAEWFAYSARGLVGYTNQLGKATRFGNDAAHRRTFETNAHNEVTQFTFNPAGDLVALADGKNQPTAWGYDWMGRATNKIDAAGNVTFVYRYDAEGRVTNRWTPAKGTTVYAYDAVGNLTNVNYPASPDVRYTYDGGNRLASMTDAVGTTAFGYTSVGSTAFEDGPWTRSRVTYGYTAGQFTSVSLTRVAENEWQQSYTYDKGRRLKTVQSPAGLFTYSYAGASRIMTNLVLGNGAIIANAVDKLGRLAATRLRNSIGTELNAHVYLYDAAGRKTNMTRVDNSTVRYKYDDVGQLKTVQGFEFNQGARLHEQLGYAYDAAGNLNYRTNHGLLQTFAVNNLNQMSNATRSGTLTVAGTTLGPASSVTVNGLTAGRYADNTFAKDNFSLVDGTNTFTAVAQDTYGRTDINSVAVYLPATNSFQYDLNGNLLTDGHRHFAYDDENQLTVVIVTNSTKSEFLYDGVMRRRICREYVWQNGAWQKTSELRYVYSGLLVLEERDANNLALVTYTRGSDLSGTRMGAGGIGGLLARTDALQSGARRHAYYHTDGSGNVTMLLDALQLLAARYLFDPFGNLLAAAGPVADANVYRFSSKEVHAPSGLVYFLYRFYEPQLQKWLNRDPLKERGGINLYAFVQNGPLNTMDTDGRQLWQLPPSKPPPDTKIQKCNRKIENDENDLVIGIANLRGHDYFSWPDGNGGTDGVGFQDPNGKDGDLPQSEAGKKSSSCRPCYKSNSPLKYGKGARKKGTAATDEEIQDCLKNRPIKGNYDGLKNNCNDWAKGAAKDCGLNCP